MSEFYTKCPKNFYYKVEVSTVFIECENKLLFLQRASNKISPGTWAIPGGKLEKNETPLEGLIREIQEELQLCPTQEVFKYLNSFYVRHPLIDYRLHLFRCHLESFPVITINTDEHQAFIWQSVEKVNELALLEGQIEAYHLAYGNNGICH